MSKSVRFRSGGAVTLAFWLALQPGCLPPDRGDDNAGPARPVAAVAMTRKTPPPAVLEPAILQLRKFSEAPMLVARVAAGKIPRVAERLPENPLVVRPIEQIGVYGGTINHAIMSEYEGWTEVAKSLNENLLGFSRPAGDSIEVDLAESYEVAPDGRTAWFHLRKGVKWSDGTPFTVDDILFWYYDVLFLTNAHRPGLVPADWLVDGKPIKLEKIDDLTLKASATQPMGLLLIRLCHENFALPAHYFKPYHPRYNPKANYADFNRRCLPMFQTLTPGVPRLSAWISVQWNEGQRVLFERNPYYFKVDTAGNQLPYADRLSFSVVADPRVILLKFTTGELDLIGRYVAIDWLPTLAAEAPKGRFRLYSRKAEAGPAIYFNWDVADDGLRAAFRDRRVREALSIAINREEISRIVYYGNLTPGGFTLAPSSAYYWADGAQVAAEYAPDRARRLLDEAEFIDRDGDGIRELRDGRPFEVAMDFEFEKNLADLVELVTEYWRAVGVRVFPHGGRDEIVRVHRMTGDFQTFASRTALGAEDPRGSSMQWVMSGPNTPFWHRDAAKNPPPWLREGTDLFNRSFGMVDPAEVQQVMIEAQKLYAAVIPAIGFGALTRPWAANVRIGNVPPDGNFSIAVRGWGRSAYHEQLFIQPTNAAVALAPQSR